MNSSVARALRVLDLLVADQRPWRLSEMATELRSSRSGLHALLATMVDGGYVERLTGGFYQLGLKVRRIADSIGTSELVQAAAVVMDRLVAKIGEGAILGVLHGAEVSYIHLVESNQAVRVHARVGDRIAAHSTSTGLALLACQDEAYISRHLSHALSASTPVTIRDRGELLAELRRTRARGYAINRGGWHVDVGGIAAPVPGPHGPVAALCIALPLFRMNQSWIRRVAPLVQAAAAEIGTACSGQPTVRRAAT